MTYVLRTPPMPHRDAEALAAVLSEAEEPQAGAVSVVEVEDRRGLWRVDAYYEEEPSPEALDILNPYRGQFLLEQLPDIDWVARSLQGLPPVKAGRFLIHGSHHRGRMPPGGVKIEIDAAAAFGTGHHATTRGCLLALDRLLKRRRPRSVLDVGTGTGVLAIAAARVARAGALATDIDPQAVRIARVNAKSNAVPELVDARLSAGAPERTYARLGRFDLVFANILAGPLLALAPHLAASISAGGTLILSGLAVAQERHVAAGYRNRGLVLAGRIREGYWSTLIFERRKGQRPAAGSLPGWSGRSGAKRARVQRLPPQTIWWISLRLTPMSSSSRSSSASR